MLSFRYVLYHFPKCCLLWWFFFPFHKINSKLSNFILYQFEGLHNLWDTPDKRDDEWATGRAGTLERKLHSIKNRIRIIVKNSNPQKTGVMLYPTVLLFVSYSFTVLQVPKISRFQLFDFAVFRAGRTGFQDIRIAFCWSISMPNIIQSNSFHVRLRTSGRSLDQR